MAVVQRTLLILLDREVEDSRVRLDELDEVDVFAIVRSDDVCATEAELRVPAAGDEHGAVVDRDCDSLLDRLYERGSVVPQRRRRNGAPEEVRVL